jgi:hypothetical protein
MRRSRPAVVAKLMASLFCGMVVATAIGYLTLISDRDGPVFATRPPVWPVAVPVGTPPPTDGSHKSSMWQSAQGAWYIPPGSNTPTLVAHSGRVGFPFRAFALVQVPAAKVQEGSVLWFGFIVDVLLYAALIWFAAKMPFMLRRRRRIARELCPSCAYPFGVDPVCTECGEPLPVYART